jgi:hypothetical protein
MKRIPTLRRVFVIGLTWGILWLVFALSIGTIIAAVDPDSIDPGETQIAVFILGPMGIFSGLAFGFLSSLGDRSAGAFHLSLSRAVLWGFLGSAIVQLGYLDHGDLGLAANIQMAFVFSTFGGLVSTIWLLMARRWSQWRSLQSSPH